MTKRPRISRRRVWAALLLIVLGMLLVRFFVDRDSAPSDARRVARPLPTAAVQRALLYVDGDKRPTAFVSAAGRERLSGVVVDLEGDPVAGARVSIVGWTHPPIVSGEDGWFEQDGLPAGEVLLAADRPWVAGYANYSIGHPEPAVIVVRPGADLTVYVQDSRDASSRCRHFDPHLGRHKGVTGPDGRHTAKGVLPGDAFVHVTANGYAAAQAWVNVSHSGAEVRVELLLGMQIEGRVEEQSGQPIAGASILIGGIDHQPIIDSEPESSVVTDAAGSFSITIARDEPIVLLARHPDYMQGHVGPLVATASETAMPRQRIVLESGHTVRGIVTHVDERPASGATVWLREEAVGVAIDRQRSVSTNERGEFAFAAVQSTALTVWADAHGARSEEVELEAPTADVLRIALSGRGRLRGTVVDVDGAPAAHAQVVAILAEERHEQARRFTGATDAEGTFVIEGLAAKEYLVAAGTPEETLYPWRMPHHVSVQPDGPDVRLRLPPRAQVVAKVVDGQGRQISGQVYLGGLPPQSFTDGALRMADVPEGRYDLLVIGTAGERVWRFELEVRAPTFDLGTIVVLEPETVQGVVMDCDGRPVSRARVSLGSRSWLDDQTPARLLERAFELFSITGADGTFSMQVLPGDDMSARADAPGMRSWAQPVAPGQSVRLVLEPTGALLGRVTNAGGRGIAQAIELHRIGGSQLVRLRSGSDGFFAYSTLPIGRYRVSLSSWNTDTASARSVMVTIQAGQTTRNVELRDLE